MYSEYWKRHITRLDSLFKKSNIDYASINTREDYVKSLMTLFKKRAVKK
jgi:hypothetical protein